jgi:transposase
MAGLGQLQAKPQSGPRPRLMDQDYRELEELLSKGATAYGWPNDLWTAGRVAQIIQTHFGVRYHPAHVCRILKERLNWTPQRPQHHHKDRNDTAIQRWVRESFPCILEAAVARGASLAFVDEAGFMLEPTVKRTYAPRGKTPVHRIANPHGRISTIGAIVLTPSRDRIDLVYGLLGDNLNFQGPAVVQFPRTLHSTVAGRMTVFWDRIPIHECEEVEEYIADQSDVVLEPFPPHAPELNPADGIWRYVKYGRLPNYTPPDLGVLRQKIIGELDWLRGQADLLKSFIRFTKLPIGV